MEVIDIGLDDIDADLNKSRSNSVNFGSGIELLMNDKKKGSSSNTKIDLAELDQLENDLNALNGVGGGGSSTPNGGGGTKTINNLGSFGGFGNLFNFGSSGAAEEEKKANVTFENNDSNIGHATAESTQNTSKTWDGFMKMGSSFTNGGGAGGGGGSFFSSAAAGGATSGASGAAASGSNMTERERRRKKRMMIKKLEEWYEKGTIKHTSHFNLDSNYEEIEDEYEGALEDKRKKDSIKLQGWWFSTVVNTIEYGNALLNPFDLNLDGWGEQVSEDLDSYEEIFAELHDKYKGGKMAPELSLLLRLGFSAAVVNMSNKMLSSSAPGFSDVMKQSPELMRMFNTAAVDMMSKQSPTFDFAKNMMNPPDQVNTKMGPPPAAVETKNAGNMSQRPMTPAANFSSVGGGASAAAAPRPGQGMQFTGPGSSDYPPMNSVPVRRPDLAYASNGGNGLGATSGFNESIPSNFNTSSVPSGPSVERREMRGPQTTDIENILSGLKTKPVSSNPNPNPSVPVINANDMFSGDDSMISIASLGDLSNGNMPKRTTRKPRKNNSEKNTVSLDI